HTPWLEDLSQAIDRLQLEEHLDSRQKRGRGTQPTLGVECSPLGIVPSASPSSPKPQHPMKDTRGQLKTSQGLYSVSLSEVLIVDLSAVQELSEVCEEFHADCCLLLLGGTSLLKPLASQLAKEPLSSNSHGTEREWTFLSGFL
ncbi:hypothetical protein KUCAC02_037638, partial [Chaenocephalus aceratus]